ncbi:hypothetical protein FrEUN1fDRAFT_5709 [Parafrankia sp. EUN1f]|nr:hypothetical protein FrEUN1fDRAFT_5709 [Parafrankia sp. EUN1f]
MSQVGGEGFQAGCGAAGVEMFRVCDGARAEGVRAVGSAPEPGPVDLWLVAGAEHPIGQVGEVRGGCVSGCGCGSQQLQALRLEFGVMVGVLGDQPGVARSDRPDQGLSQPAVLGDDCPQSRGVVRVDLAHPISERLTLGCFGAGGLGCAVAAGGVAVPGRSEGQPGVPHSLVGLRPPCQFLPKILSHWLIVGEAGDGGGPIDSEQPGWLPPAEPQSPRPDAGRIDGAQSRSCC